MCQIRSCLVFVVLLSCHGCAHWEVSESDGELSVLPPFKMPSDSVAWQVISLTIAPDALSDLDAIWSEIDESHMSVELADRLRANGLRCGLVGLQLPPELRSLVDDQDELTISENGTPTFDLADVPQWHRLQTRAGQRKEIAIGDLREKVNILYFESDALVGDPLHQAQCMLALESKPLDDGRVQISLTPEIQHGFPRSRFVGKSGAFQQQVRRDKWSREELRIEATLAPGESLVLTHSAEPKGVGSVFFRDESSGESRQTLMLFRLAQTQKDALSWDTQSPGMTF